MYFGFKEREPHSNEYICLAWHESLKPLNFSEMEAKVSACEVKSNVEQDGSLLVCREVHLDPIETDVEQMQHNDGIIRVLDSQSILFFMSDVNILRGIVCEQSHLSRIKY